MSSTKPYRICCVIPFYNNRKTVDTVAGKVREYIHDIILVNDGSTDGSETTLRPRPGQIILTHDVNRGKGAAVMTGMKHARKERFTHVLQIDADDQMNPGDIPAFLEMMKRYPDSLLVGRRQFDDTTPRSSRFGRWFSNLWFSIETLGYPSPDTQSGYRLYPTALFDGLNSRCFRMDFEVDILVRALMRGYPVRSLPVNTRYFTGDDRVSHFRPIHDNFLISLAHTRLTLSLIYRWPGLLYAHRHLKP